MYTKEFVGKKLKEYRETHNLNQDDIARKAHVSTDAVSKWETGKRNPGLTGILELCQNLGVSVEQLFGLDDKKKLLMY